MMHYAIIYLDTTRRVRLFAEGNYTLESNVRDVGWAMEEDGASWPDLQDTLKETAIICHKAAYAAKTKENENR